MFLVFATFAIDDPSLSQDIDNVDRISVVLKIIEIVILGIFCLEILMKSLAFGFKVIISIFLLPFELKRSYQQKIKRNTSQTVGLSLMLL